MKTVLIVLDGVSDDPIPQLAGRTPLEASFIPNIHYIASMGKVGRIQTTFKGFPIESMVCIMGLLGYAPQKYYPNGRASFEALAKGISLAEDDLVLRCNLVSADPKKQILADFTAGLITDSNARVLISGIKLPYKNWELYPGQSYRNILIIRGCGLPAKYFKCFEPHMHIGEKIEGLLPRAMHRRADKLAEQLRAFLLDSQSQIKRLKLPKECKANMLWTWSPSEKPVWPAFHSLTGLKGAAVGGLDFINGIAMSAGLHFDVIPGATGYTDTDYQAKGEYAVKYLKDYDFVLVHINAPDEAAHQHDWRGKIAAIERADEYVVGPILRHLQSKYPGRFRVFVCGDHKTRCSDGKHCNSPVPYAKFDGSETIAKAGFTERNCASHAPISSLSLLRNS